MIELERGDAVRPSVPVAPQARRAPQRRRAEGPLGVELRFLWGEQIVGEHFLAPGVARRFTIGSGHGVDFAMGDRRLGGTAFDLIEVGSTGATLRFTPKMTGEVRRGEHRCALLEAEGLERDGATFALPLTPDDFVWVDLGGIVVEVFFQPQPKAVFVPFSQGADFVVLNIFLGCFFLAALFVISAANSGAEGEAVDDGARVPQVRVAKLLVKPPEPARAQTVKRDQSSASAKQAGAEGKAGRPNAPVRTTRAATRGAPSPQQARALMSAIFGRTGGGVSTVLGRQSLGDELTEAIGHVVGVAPGDAAGGGGLGALRGGLGGGGDVEQFGARIGTQGRGGGNDHYGERAGVLIGKQAVQYELDSQPPEVVGALDRELIRRVIHANVGQIRFCYESQLSRFPTLSGKVAIKFLITATGTVATASVAQSTVANAELEACVVGRVRTWQFPKPRGGGVVVVTYPFLFKQSGA